MDLKISSDWGNHSTDDINAGEARGRENEEVPSKSHNRILLGILVVLVKTNEGMSVDATGH